MQPNASTSFYYHHKKLHTDLGPSLSADQQKSLAELRTSFASIENEHKTNAKALANLQEQKELLDAEIRHRVKERDRLKKEAEDLRAETDNVKKLAARLKKGKKKLQDEVADLERQHKRLVKFKGKYKKAYKGAVLGLESIHEYTLSNRCKTKVSLEQNIRTKCVEAGLEVCGSCGHAESTCSC